MGKEIIVTTDGSHSIAIPEMGVTYHSSHGAVQESMHVFIAAGWQAFVSGKQITTTVNVLEMGFGTGLNALLTLAEAEKNQQAVFYETLELYPLEASLYTALNYCRQLNRPDLQPLFELLHTCNWNMPIAISPYFTFTKYRSSLLSFETSQHYHLVYFDAFAPESQPDLWTVSVFTKLYNCMEPGALLTTYCSKSIVRKAMTAAGLTVEKIPGPPHKREMVRARKLLVE